IYALDASGSQVYSIDATTFVVTALPSPLGLVGLNSPKTGFDAAGTLWALNVNTNTIFTINTTTGVGTYTGASTSTGSVGLAIAATVCPAAPTTTTTTTVAPTVVRFTG